LIKIFLKIGNAAAGPFDVIAKIKHNTGEKIKYQRKTNCQKGRIDKKKPDFGYRNMKPFAQISANTKRISFKKG